MSEYKSIREELAKDASVLVSKLNDLYTADKIKNQVEIKETWKKLIQIRNYSETINYIETELAKTNNKIDDYYVMDEDN